MSDKRSNILGSVPERLAVMWQNSRKTVHGWEVPIQVSSAEPGRGGGNVIAVIALDGHGGTSSTQSDVESTAAEIVRCYNAIAAERDGDPCPDDDDAPVWGVTRNDVDPMGMDASETFIAGYESGDRGLIALQYAGEHFAGWSGGTYDEVLWVRQCKPTVEVKPGVAVRVRVGVVS
jgi:hypothetical protein